MNAPTVIDRRGTSLDPAHVSDLRAATRAELIGPDDPAYDEARHVFNAMHDRHPALIIRPGSVADVISAVRFAREHDLPLAVRGGGHSVPGYGTLDGGLVVDLVRMRGIRVDPARRLVRAEGGVTWGDLNHAAHAFGLATTGGAVSTTGIGGLTLGGGLGHLARAFGLASDNLVSADVVTADGQFLSCSEDEHADLFWALRGGGGNFGVVTSFEYRLHPVDTILAGPILFEPDAGVIAAYRDFISYAPPEFGGILGLIQAPPLPFVPEAWHGRFVTAILVCWSGSLVEGERLVRSVESFGSVVGRHVGPMPYPVVNTLFDEIQPPGLQNYWKSRIVRDLPDAAIDLHLEHGAQVPTIESGTFFFPINGAVHRPAGATAFPHRAALFSVGMFGMWADPADNDANIRWVRDYDAAVAPWSEPTGYVNFISPEDAAGQPAAGVYGATYARLTAVKRAYDPENVFRSNANILPARS